jgi:hypothetical protein
MSHVGSPFHSIDIGGAAQRKGRLVAPSPEHNHHSYDLWLLAFVQGSRFESNFGHLFHSRRQLVVKRILVEVEDNTRTMTPVPSD